LDSFPPYRLYVQGRQKAESGKKKTTTRVILIFDT